MKSLKHNITILGLAITVAGASCDVFASAPSPTITPVNTMTPPSAGGGIESCSAQVVEQSYEHGFMFWIGSTGEEKCVPQHSFDVGTGEIWVAFANHGSPSGKWLVFVDDWDSTKDPERDLAVTPPPGFTQPHRGFGKVWSFRLSDSDRKQLGWATGDEFLIQTDYQYEAGVFVNNQGQQINRPGKHMLVGLAGDKFVFDEVSQTVTYTDPP